MSKAQAQILSGPIAIERGTRSDYLELAHLHYAPGHPTCIAGVWRAVWRDPALDPRNNCKLKIFNSQFAIASRIVGVAVLCHPVPSSDARERALQLTHARDPERIRWLNTSVRTITRVIVHPQFRSLGIASALVRRVLDESPTRYVEAFAVMGRIVPFFQKAGMRETEPGYFLFDRESDPARTSSRKGGVDG